MIAFGIAVSVRGQRVDPAALLAAVADLVEAHGIEVMRSGDILRFGANQLGALTLLAEPIAAWWQAHNPTTGEAVALEVIGPAGVNAVTYCRADLAVEAVRHLIETESGRAYLPGEASGPLRRLGARLIRAYRSGFTATEVHVSDDGDCVTVAVAGREIDDTPRSVEFQAAIPDPGDWDPDDPEDSYCLVNEKHHPVFAALTEVRLTGQALHLDLTPQAARDWRLKSTRITIRLRMDQQEIESCAPVWRGSSPRVRRGRCPNYVSDDDPTGEGASYWQGQMVHLRRFSPFTGAVAIFEPGRIRP